MHTQGNKIFEDGRKRSFKLFKRFKVISGSMGKVPEDNSISHPLHSHWSRYASQVCDSSPISWLLKFDSKCIKIDMRHDQISQNPSQSYTLVTHTARVCLCLSVSVSFSLSLTLSFSLSSHLPSPLTPLPFGPTKKKSCGHREDSHLQTRMRALIRNQTCWHFDLGLPVSRTRRKHISAVEDPPSVAFCYDGLSWLSHQHNQVLLAK